MPTIKEYNSPVEGLRPSDTGEVSLVRAGRVEAELGNETAHEVGSAVSGLGNVAKQYGEFAEKHFGLQEIVNGAAQAAQLHAAHQQYADNLFKDPNNLNNPAIGNQVLANAQPDYDKFLAGFNTDTGRRWAQEQVARDKESLVTRTMADQSAKQGESIQTNLHSWINTTSDSVYRNPMGMKQAIDSVDPLVNSMMANMPGLTVEQQVKFQELGTEAKQKIQEASLYGMADKNPAAAKRWYETHPGDYDQVDGVKAHQMFDFMQRTATQEQRAAHYDQVMQREDNDRQQLTNFLTNGQTSADGHWSAAPGSLQQMIQSMGKPGGASPVAIRQAMEFADKPDTPHSTPGFEHEVISGLASGKYQMSDLLNFVDNPNGPSLSKSDALGIRALVDGITTPEKQLLGDLQTEAKANLAPAKDLLGNIDAVGAHNLTKFNSWELQAIQQGFAQGKSRTAMLDPRSPDYILKNVPWTYFQGSMTDAVNGAVQSIDPSNTTLAGLVNAPTAAAAAASTPAQGGDTAHRSSFVQRIATLGEQSGPYSVSPKGATGEMQVMPGTASSPGFGIRPSDGTMEDTARVGREYATALWDNYRKEAPNAPVQGTEVLASAAYNAGPQRVREWLNSIGDPRTGQITPQQFLERIPLSETKNYVARVTGIWAPGVTSIKAPVQTPAIPPDLAYRIRTMTPAQRANYLLWGQHGASSSDNPFAVK